MQAIVQSDMLFVHMTSCLINIIEEGDGAVLRIEMGNVMLWMVDCLTAGSVLPNSGDLGKGRRSGRGQRGV